MQRKNHTTRRHTSAGRSSCCRLWRTEKANLTGSVAHISAEAIESRSVASVSAALAGQIPGVTAIQSSGALDRKPQVLRFVEQTLSTAVAAGNC